VGNSPRRGILEDFAKTSQKYHYEECQLFKEQRNLGIEKEQNEQES
jgi:hypothetical protein